MQVCIMKILSVLVVAMSACCSMHAQTEMGDGPETSNRWGMISFHYVQTPQFNGNANTGFGFQFFFDTDANRRFWSGASFTITGINRRSGMLIGGGGGAWLVGTGRLGVFSYAMTGLGISSNSGLTGFNFFTDPSLTFGWASQIGLGACIEIVHNVRIHVTGMAMHFSNEQGATPLGVQAGIVLGGR